MAQIASSLSQSRLAEMKRRFLNDLRSRIGVRILLEPPRAAVTAERGPSRGPTAAPVTIVEFADFQCPYCRNATATIKRLEEQYGDQIRLVFRHFPLPMHKDAPKAAEAAECAKEQGQFWRFHDKLFEGQAALEIPNLKKRAGELGLNAVQFETCLDSGKGAVNWQRDRDEGQRYGVSATPTFFINGRLVAGALPYAAFSEIIEEELSRLTPGATRRSTLDSAAKGK